MIIVLKNANFSASNIGTLSSWRIARSIGTGANYEGPISVDKGAAFSATITLAEGYEIGTAGVTITMGGTVLSGAYSINGNVITITIAEVTGNVLIKVPTINTATGEEEEPEEPDTPVTPDVPDTPAGWAIYDNFDRENTTDGIGSTNTGEVWEYANGTTQLGGTDTNPDNDRAQLLIKDGKVQGYMNNVYPSALVTTTQLDKYVEMEIVDNGYTNGQILLFPKWQNAQNYVAARLDRDGYITLLYKQNGQNTEVTKSTTTFTTNNIVLAIQCIGNNYIVFVNGEQLLTGTITASNSATRVGFSIAGTKTTCDNFKVKYL